MANPNAKMPEVFSANPKTHARGVTGLRRNRSNAVQPIDTVVYDGDTIQVHLNGSGSLRFLGIDTAELKLGNRELRHPILVQKFGDRSILEIPGIDEDLADYLEPRINGDTALNQFRHAEHGQRALQKFVLDDIAAMGETPDTFRLFLSFSYEVFEGHGRFLVFVNRDQRETETLGPRPLSYNERMLELGMSLPFFIWPNISPFRETTSVIDAVPAPNTLRTAAERGKLGLARRLVKEARQRARPGDGTVFDPADPQMLEGFELRFLDRKRLPSRAVIDLSRRSDVLLRPQNYWKIPQHEDRLFVPAEFVPAFVARGWRLEGW